MRYAFIPHRTRRYSSSRQDLTMIGTMSSLPGFSARRSRRRGVLILVFAVFLTVCIALLALSIDVGMVANVQTDLQRSADAAALAGARDLINGRVDAIASAEEYARLNNAGTHRLTNSEVQVEVGHWNKTSLVFQRDAIPLNAVKVTTQRQDAPFFFGQALGRDNYT